MATSKPRPKPKAKPTSNRKPPPGTLGTVGERPVGIFGGVPVSELAILAGLIALVVGTIDHGNSATDVGIIVMALGVTEVTAREHLSGYRSHTTLLAFMPAVLVEAIYALVIGAPQTADPAAGAGHPGVRHLLLGLKPTLPYR